MEEGSEEAERGERDRDRRADDEEAVGCVSDEAREEGEEESLSRADERRQEDDGEGGSHSVIFRGR